MVSLRMTCLTGLIRPPHASQLDDASAIASSSPCPIKTACISHQKKPAALGSSHSATSFSPPFCSQRRGRKLSLHRLQRLTSVSVLGNFTLRARRSLGPEPATASIKQVGPVPFYSRPGPPHRKRSPVHIRLLLLSASSGFPSTLGRRQSYYSSTIFVLSLICLCEVLPMLPNPFITHSKNNHPPLCSFMLLKPPSLC